jgi:hypothetical protein
LPNKHKTKVKKASGTPKSTKIYRPINQNREF